MVTDLTVKLKPGFTFYEGTCQCGKTLWRVDTVEGCPVYACVDHCGQAYPSDPESLRKRKEVGERER